MQRDFHYHCIKVLANKAGFDKQDAQIIAYASQYVDDSTESELIKLNLGHGDYLRFDPVRTAHIGLESTDWSTQKRVYIPFHFIPPKPFRPNDQFSFAVESDSEFAQLLLEEAVKGNGSDKDLQLCQIGIALHTYADTWAHQQFSGICSHENDVEDIQLYDRGSGNYEDLIVENVLFDLLPQIGHAEAGFFPDLAFQGWKYKQGKSPRRDIKRDNTEQFLLAAAAIYVRLCRISGKNLAGDTLWDSNLKPKIRGIMSIEPEKIKWHEALSVKTYKKYHDKHLQERCKQWEDEFPEVFDVSYDQLDWRKSALKGDTDWDDYSRTDWPEALPFELAGSFWDSHWVNFHRAALKQRHFVLENMP